MPPRRRDCSATLAETMCGQDGTRRPDDTLKLEGDKYNIKVKPVAPLATTGLTQDCAPRRDFLDKLKPESSRRRLVSLLGAMPRQRRNL